MSGGPPPAGASSPAPALGWPRSWGVRTSDATGTACADVAAADWLPALRHVHAAGFTMIDWLSAVDEPDAQPPSLDVLVHVVALAPLRHLMVRTRVPASDPRLPSATAVWAGAAWHERETHEMFGIGFDGFEDGSGAGLRPLLLPDGFEGTPLRKSFHLAARAARSWPGAKEPGEPDAERSPARRSLLPPGVPEPGWGPRDG